LEITKTVLSLMLVVVITTLTSLTTIAAYAGEGDDNRQKAEDESAAAIADCDDNEVEQAGFDCIAIAARDTEIETEPPEESATLSVCKEMSSSSASGFEPDDYAFTVTGNNPSPAQFVGSANCVDVTIGPGEFVVSERFVPGGGFTLTLSIDPTSECMRTSGLSATGEIQAGETQECTFINTVGD
jgi:hypothetical protein